MYIREKQQHRPDYPTPTRLSEKLINSCFHTEA